MAATKAEGNLSMPSQLYPLGNQNFGFCER